MNHMHWPASSRWPLALCFATAAIVGKARVRYRIAAPTTTGDERFERAFRVQMNTLENVVIFVPALWLCALFFGPLTATALGALWLVGRVWYAAPTCASRRRAAAASCSPTRPGRADDRRLVGRAARARRRMSATPASGAPAAARLRPLRGLLPYVGRYKPQIALALLFLLLAAASTLALPYAVRLLVDGGFALSPGADAGARLAAIRSHFLGLFGVAVALGVFTAARFYMVTWLGERVTTDLRQAVYAHVLQQSPQFFETLKTGEVLSRLTTDTTVIQNAVGSSISMGLRNTVLFAAGWRCSSPPRRG